MHRLGAFYATLFNPARKKKRSSRVFWYLTEHVVVCVKLMFFALDMKMISQEEIVSVVFVLCAINSDEIAVDSDG